MVEVSQFGTVRRKDPAKVWTGREEPGMFTLGPDIEQSLRQGTVNPFENRAGKKEVSKGSLMNNSDSHDTESVVMYRINGGAKPQNHPR